MNLPQDLDAAVAQAVTNLLQETSCLVSECQTHQVVVVQGWATTPDTVRCLATYLVGLLASAITTTLEVRAQITNSDADRLELLRSAEQIVGRSAAPLTVDQKQDQRNPWIAEGLWHLYFFLASRQTALHPLGSIVAVGFPHVAAKDHGLDVLAIYRDGSHFGLSVVESKAYENDPNGAISDAVKTFRRIDDGKYDSSIRQFVATARMTLPSEQQSAVSPSLWKDLRSYIPNPHYDSQNLTDWSNKRPSFSRLAVPAKRVIVMPHAVDQFTKFFDEVAAAMLAVAENFNV